MATFGTNLRRARTERGLSQAELGGERFSASYISHLERGKRMPTTGVAEYLAARLAVSVGVLLDDLSSDSVSATVSQVLLYEALTRHEYDTVDRGAMASTSAGDHFAAMQVRAQAQLERGDFRECLRTTDELLESAVAATSPVLRAITLAIRSRALRADGALSAARDAATEAVEAVEAKGDCPTEVVVAARTAEIAALAELGDASALALATEELDRLTATLPEGHSRALAAWSIGNVRFAEGRIAEAVAAHDEAARLLRPEASLRAWARFHKATAALRVEAGIDDSGVDALIERAAHGLAIVGNAHDCAELDLLRARRSIPTDPLRALNLAGETLDGNNLPNQTVAEAELVRASALEALGRRHEQTAALRHAAEALTSSGATERAVSIWRAVVESQEPAAAP
ncbi:helix-turn-helix transcriptional regulator [Curtobacterium sp. ISL-83]|uniref:helix-turn-helix domain-containing protein n=1 Tax=Curtobacterium sp. ISL-83 TaxID=2819145 RepID=UPI001BE83AC6|nr:helix-turn-helix transcriptional regulator [Curtobacterium sp. ISL-83]MBT2504252.1 helix-turn-helix transcriptional regulator [Curtobacterium sp. ISL-83]